jgi:urease subunit gamma
MPEVHLSSMMLTPREREKLIIYQVAALAQERKDRGVKLNVSEAIALIAKAVLEAARDGKTVQEAESLGKQVLTREDVMEPVPEMIPVVQVEGTFKDGTQLISVTNPIT